jgi:hypothetical protein
VRALGKREEGLEKGGIGNIRRRKAFSSGLPPVRAETKMGSMAAGRLRGRGWQPEKVGASRGTLSK